MSPHARPSNSNGAWRVRGALWMKWIEAPYFLPGHPKRASAVLPARSRHQAASQLPPERVGESPTQGAIGSSGGRGSMQASIAFKNSGLRAGRRSAPAQPRRAAVVTRAGLLDFLKPAAKSQKKNNQRAQELVKELLALAGPTQAGDKASEALRAQIAELVRRRGRELRVALCVHMCASAHARAVRRQWHMCQRSLACRARAGGPLQHRPMSCTTGDHWQHSPACQCSFESRSGHIQQMFSPLSFASASCAGGRAGGGVPQGAAAERPAVGGVGRGVRRAARHDRGPVQVARGPRGVPRPGVQPGAGEGGALRVLFGPSWC